MSPVVAGDGFTESSDPRTGDDEKRGRMKERGGGPERCGSRIQRSTVVVCGGEKDEKAPSVWPEERDRGGKMPGGLKGGPERGAQGCAGRIKERRRGVG